MKKKWWIILCIFVVVIVIAFGGFKVSKVITGNAPSHSPYVSNSVGSADSHSSSSSKTVEFSDSANSEDAKTVGKIGELEKPVGNGTHSVCSDEMCVSVPGNGTNECDYNVDCFPSNETHLGCVNNSCTLVEGGGVDSCDYSGQSCGNQTNETNLECVSSSCTEVQGIGTNGCSSGKDCLVVEKKGIIETFTKWFKGIFGR